MRYKIFLTKYMISNGHTRYYKMELFATLFGEYALERVYGNICYKNPTGVKSTYFSNFSAGEKQYKRILKEKIRKGYLLKKDCLKRRRKNECN